MDPAGVDQTTTSAAAGGASDDNSGQKDHTHIVKRKRTKRQRQQPSFTFCNALYSSPATSDDFPADSTTTEDEDTAKCLILLSKGHSISPTKDNINDEYFSGYKFNSKRYIQTSSSAGDGLITGVYVYECKTCSRTFPSFQALGGHRASHKKPRVNEERRKPPAFMAFSDDDEPSLQFPSRKNNSSSSSSLSMQLNTRKSSSKLHECSICGTEFNSGQALGGHMRRHRVANAGAGAGTAINTNTTLSLIPYSPVATMVAEDQDNQKSRNDGLCLDLDLNLPAPESSMASEQRRDSSFKFTANQNKQQSAVHLSPAPTLVDCHY